MKLLSKIGNWVFYIILAFTLISSVGSAVFKSPLLMSAVRSNSMYPLFQKGDIILLSPFFSSNKVEFGDIIVFKTEGGSYDSNGWIVHRIIGGSLNEGYITKGDANDYTDQSAGNNPPIKTEWIVACVSVAFGKPLKIPLLGEASLFMEKYAKKSFVLPVLALVIGLIIGLSEFFSKEKKKNKHKSLNMQLIYFLSGITISILMFGSMLASSQHLNITYEVSELSNGVIMGSSVGILKIGDTIERPLVELNNKGLFPTIAIITCNDKQISISQQKLLLKQGVNVSITMKVNAIKPGKYNSAIHTGMFFSLLPQNIIYSIAKKNYWLALILVSLIPGLPLMLYPLFDSTMRRKTLSIIRHKIRRIKINFS